MIDFTADWCPTCKVLEATVLSSGAIRDAVAQNRVVIMKADTSHKNPKLMKMIGANAVPALAIFPADNPNRPIVFRDMYTVADVLDALKKAGPSKP
jgi:thiol:disulfide interchange protein